MAGLSVFMTELESLKSRFLLFICGRGGGTVEIKGRILGKKLI